MERTSVVNEVFARRGVAPTEFKRPRPFSRTELKLTKAALRDSLVEIASDVDELSNDYEETKKEFRRRIENLERGQHWLLEKNGIEPTLKHEPKEGDELGSPYRNYGIPNHVLPAYPKEIHDSGVVEY